MPTLILDFDDTLFDTFSLKQAQFEAVKPFLIKPTWRFWQQRVARSATGMYLYKQHIKNGIAKNNYPRAVRAYEAALTRRGTFVYADTMNFLKEYQKKYKIILLSYGLVGFQMHKIKQARIQKFFNKIIITQRKKYQEFLRIKKQFTAPYLFIDNSSEEIELMKRNYPEVICVRMRRSNDPDRRVRGKKYDYQITNLRINLQNYD